MSDSFFTFQPVMATVPLNDNVYFCHWRSDGKNYFYTGTGQFLTAADIQPWLTKYNKTLEAVTESPKDTNDQHTIEGLREALIFYKLPLGEAANEQELMTEWEYAVTKRLNDFALEKQYASIAVACSYNASTVPEWAMDAQIAIKSRDDTWLTANQLEPQITSGALSIEAALEQLPVLSWA